MKLVVKAHKYDDFKADVSHANYLRRTICGQDAILAVREIVGRLAKDLDNPNFNLCKNLKAVKVAAAYQLTKSIRPTSDAMDSVTKVCVGISCFSVGDQCASNTSATGPAAGLGNITATKSCTSLMFICW